MKKILKSKKISIYSHNDLDGVVSALFVLVGLGFKSLDQKIVQLQFFNHEVNNIHSFEENIYKIKADSNYKIVCDLAYVSGIGLWFEHHHRKNVPESFSGAYDPECPSAASLIFDYYKNVFLKHPRYKDFLKLKSLTDKIDSGQISLRQIINPKNEELLGLLFDDEDLDFYPYIIQKLLTLPLSQFLEEPKIKGKIKLNQKQQNKDLDYIFSKKRIKHLNPKGIIIVQFQGRKVGNSFLVLKKYKQFELFCTIIEKDKGSAVRFYANSVYKEVFDEKRQKYYKIYDLSKLARNNGGGGHKGVGGFNTTKQKADKFIQQMIDIDSLPNWGAKQEKIDELIL